MTDPFVLLRPTGRAVPVLLSSPHSGDHYPLGERQRLGVHPDTLATLHDGPVHELFLPAVETGATLIRALWSRAWVDLNRDPTELDDHAIPDLPRQHAARSSPRVRAGLGVVPTRLGERRVHQRGPLYQDVLARLAAVHRPYHAAIEGECRRLVETFGRVLLIDCHSMPGAATGPNGVPDIALGDRFGRSCGGDLVELVETLFRQAGFSVARNQPFAGGWITERHGVPERHVDALQLEVRRDLFLSDTGPGVGPAHARLRAVARDLVDRLGPRIALSRPIRLDAAE